MNTDALRGRPPLKNPGDPLPAADWNSLVLASQPGPSRQQVAAGFGGISLLRVSIVAVSGDYVTVSLLGGADGNTVQAGQFFAARMPLLRNSVSTRNGISYTYTGTDARTADNGSETEDQVLVPGLVVGDTAFVVGPVRNGTGVTVGGEAVAWLLLSDGHAWTEEDTA